MKKHCNNLSNLYTELLQRIVAKLLICCLGKEWKFKKKTGKRCLRLKTYIHGKMFFGSILSVIIDVVFCKFRIKLNLLERKHNG
jgi:hypothetical protein